MKNYGGQLLHFAVFKGTFEVRLYKKILINKTLAETQSFAISYFSVKTSFAVPEKILKEFKLLLYYEQFLSCQFQN